MGNSQTFFINCVTNVIFWRGCKLFLMHPGLKPALSEYKIVTLTTKLLWPQLYHQHIYYCSFYTLCLPTDARFQISKMCTMSSFLNGSILLLTQFSKCHVAVQQSLSYRGGCVPHTTAIGERL